MRGVVRRDLSDESGFSIVETSVALGIIFFVLLGLLASLNTGVRGLLTGRQRSGGVAVAKEVVEEARAAAYADLGHDLSGDATLATDSAVTGTAPNYSYQPEGVAGPEALVGAANPTYAAHEWQDSRDGTTFTVRVYVTLIEPAAGDDHKRLTVAVSWDGEQYDADVISNEVRVSTFVSQYGVASGAEVSGIVDVDTGAVTISGTLSGISLTSARMLFPLVHADVAGDLVNETHGYAQSSQSELVLTSGAPSGCTAVDETATCEGVTAETVADNDAGTAAPLQDEDGPVSDLGGTVSAGTPLSLSLGSTGTVSSQSSAQSCVLCVPSVGDGDGLLYAVDSADGAASMAANFQAGSLRGPLVDVDSAGSSTATIDSDVVGAGQHVSSTGRLVVPALDLVGITGGPVGFTSAISVGGVDVSATASAGLSVSSPGVSGSAVSLQVYDTGALGVPTYRSISVTPGVSLSDEASVSFNVGGGLVPLNTVSLDTTVEAAQASTDSSVSGGTTTSAEANLTNWLVISVHLVIVEAGTTVADLTVELDYGRIVAQAGYEL
ncbi:MAG: hypothetical protein HYU28_01825 [Actinobacteria bacterium]|nr:hypothetical protein [Actinomycetota bacterium]